MEQLTLFDATGNTERRSARNCPYADMRHWDSMRKVVCTRNGTGFAEVVWTQCYEGLWGEPPQCAYEPLDNSEEAAARRREWARKHEKKRGG